MQEIKNEGWIALHRKLLKSDMWKALTSMQRDLTIAIFLKANHKPNQWEWEGNIFTCQAGEFITSLGNLKTECAKGTSIKMVRSGLKKLEKWDFLAYKGAKTGTKISIINWDTYQNQEEVKGKEKGRIGARRGQDKGKIGATNNNVKNENNVKNVKKKYGEFKHVLLTDPELDKLKTKFPDWQNKIKAMDEGIEMKGYKYKNHYLAILKWGEKDEKTTGKVTPTKGKYSQVKKLGD